MKTKRPHQAVPDGVSYLKDTKVFYSFTTLYKLGKRASTKRK
jgi:hypothetical protein